MWVVSSHDLTGKKEFMNYFMFHFSFKVLLCGHQKAALAKFLKWKFCFYWLIVIIVHFNSEVKFFNLPNLISRLWQNYEICSSSPHELTPQEQEDEEVDEVSERQGFNPLTPLIQVFFC